MTVYYSKDVANLVNQYPQVKFHQVSDTTEFLGQVAANHITKLRKLNPKLQVIAITGSVGKTTTKDLVGQMLSNFGETVYPKESYNNEIGLPLTVLEACATTDFLVLEIGANHIGEVLTLTRIAKPDVAVLLKAGVAHAGEFGGVQTILNEKVQVFAKHESEHKSGPTTCIFPGDDANSQEILHQLEQLHNITLDNSVVQQHVNGINYIALHRNSINQIKVDNNLRISFSYHNVMFHPNLIGKHHFLNALAAVLICQASLTYKTDL